MNTLVQDIRYALRMLRKSPSFAVIAIITLALGIGANTAIFSVVDAVLLKPLPYPQPNRIAAVWGTHSKMGENRRTLSYPDFKDLQAQNHVFEQVAVYSDTTTALTGAGEPMHLFAEKVSADMFTVLGVQPVLGRAFVSDEDEPGHLVAMISYKLWQSHFGADPGVVGRAMTFGGRDFTIIGVLPASFVFPFNSDAPDVWKTFSEDTIFNSGDDKPMVEERDAHFVEALARLKPGITIAEANAEADAIGNRLAAQYPDTNKYMSFEVESALDSLVGSLKPQLRVLLGAVAFVLLIGCANIANLLLARATARQREMAIRSAMGAGRGRIIRQLLIEAGMISLAGGTCGLIVAAWGTEYLVKLAAGQFARVAGTAIDGRVLAFTFVPSVVTGFLFGIAPAIQLSSQPLSEILKEGGRSSSQSARQHRLRNILIMGEMALAVILLSCAGLLIESLSNLRHVNPGINPHGVLTFAIDLPGSRYSKPEAIKGFFRQLTERMRALPGVESASTGVPLPFSESRLGTTYSIEGHPVPPSEEPHVHFRAVNVDYFRTMGISLLEGRAFAATDNASAPNVIVINQALANKAFPGENPIGKQIKPGVSESGLPPFREIIGVVGDVKVRGLDSPDDAECYTPEEQTGFDWQFGVVRTSAPPTTLVPAIRDQVRAIDKDVAIFDVKTMDEYVAKATAQPRLDSALLALFAGLALILAMVGIFGVMSYGVAQRTNEFGIRMTLGAQRGDMMGLVLKQGLGVAAIGTTVGIAAAVGATRLLSTLLFGVKPGDPLTLVAVSAILLVCALVACYIPARRTMRVDPMAALRHE
jgi:putative ABC transport system permease protein